MFILSNHKSAADLKVSMNWSGRPISFTNVLSFCQETYIMLIPDPYSSGSCLKHSFSQKRSAFLISISG